MTAPFTDLRRQTLTYTPVAGPDFSQANRYMNQAAGAAGGIRVGGVNVPGQSPMIAAQNPNQTYDALARALQQSQTPEGAELRRMAMTQLRGLGTAPNRGQLAAQNLALQRQMTEPAWQNDLRLTGQKAAAMGRLGAGMTTTELNDITLAREKALGQYGQQAALEAAGLEMQDRLNRFGATSGYQGQLTAEDLARAGFTQGNALAKFGVGSTVRGQNVDERNFRSQEGLARSGLDLAIQQARAQAAASRAGVFGGLAGQSSGNAQFGANFGANQAQTALQTLLQQQGRQDQQGQLAIDNAARQRILQDQLLNSAFNRQLTGAQAAGGMGMAGSPWGMMYGAGQGYGAGAAATQDQLARAAAAAGMYF